jgi:hypothetical protein
MATCSEQEKEPSTSNKIKIYIENHIEVAKLSKFKKKLSGTGRFCPILDDVLSYKLRKI